MKDKFGNKIEKNDLVIISIPNEKVVVCQYDHCVYNKVINRYIKFYFTSGPPPNGMSFVKDFGEELPYALVLKKELKRIPRQKRKREQALLLLKLEGII